MERTKDQTDVYGWKILIDSYVGCKKAHVTKKDIEGCLSKAAPRRVSALNG